MAGPFRLLPGVVGDLWSYTSSTPPGTTAHGNVVICHDLPRAKGSAADVAQTFPALADRLTRETAWRAVTGTLRGVGASSGDFSAQGWIDDLARLIESEVAPEAPRWLVGFGFGGALALHQAAIDDRVAGVACLGTPADLTSLSGDPEALIERCVRTGVIRSQGFPAAADTWAKEFSVLHPRQDVERLKGRPLLVVNGADDAETPLEDARTLAAAATGPSDLRVVFGAGHWLRADPRVIAILVGWLERRHTVPAGSGGVRSGSARGVDDVPTTT